MNPFFVVVDEESEYYGQVTSLIYRSTVGDTTLVMYYCKMDNNDAVNFLAYQLMGGHLLKSDAEKYQKTIPRLKK